MKMKNTAVLLMISMLAGLMACGETSDQVQETSVNKDSDTAVTTEVEETGLEAVDYGGAEILFLIREHENGDPRWGSREMDAEEENGDVLNDAVYERNMRIEEKYNIKLTTERQTLRNMQQALTKTVASSDDTYQCYMSSIGFAATASANGELYDLFELDNFNFDAPWWDQTINNSATILNRMYFAVGDMNLMTHDGAAAIFFNRELIEDYQLQNPYELVDNGKWTMDEYTELTVNFNRDLDSNGIYDENDQWGSCSTRDTVWAMVISCGGYYASKTEDDEPEFHELDERYLDILGKIAACSNVGKTYNGQSPNFNAGKPTNFQKNLDIFSDGRALIYGEVVEAANQLRSAEINFGIVPYPKYDEAQEEYITPINSFASTCISIPVTVQNTDRITHILEDMTFESRKLLRPAYFDVTLEVKLTRDERSVDMLNLIFENRIFDFGWAFDFGGVLTSGIFNEINNGNNNFASSFASISTAAKAAVDQLIEQFQS